MLKIGEILQKTREEKKLTVETIETKTKIRKKYIIAIEHNNWKIFPSITYITGIIKTYASFLGLDEKKLIIFFRREYDHAEENKFTKKLSREFFTPQTKKTIALILSILFLLFIAYFIIQLYIFVMPPKVMIISPKQTIFKQQVINLIGQTEKEAIVYINGRRIFLDINNRFSTEIPLITKKTTVTIDVTGANGRKTTVFKVFERK